MDLQHCFLKCAISFWVLRVQRTRLKTVRRDVSCRMNQNHMESRCWNLDKVTLARDAELAVHLVPSSFNRNFQFYFSFMKTRTWQTKAWKAHRTIRTNSRPRLSGHWFHMSSIALVIGFWTFLFICNALLKVSRWSCFVVSHSANLFHCQMWSTTQFSLWYQCDAI